jgi:hypothetical protein
MQYHKDVALKRPKYLFEILQIYPFQVSTYLQILDIYNHRDVADMIEVSIFQMQSAFHPLFSFRKTTILLGYLETYINAETANLLENLLRIL